MKAVRNQESEFEVFAGLEGRLTACTCARHEVDQGQSFPLICKHTSLVRTEQLQVVKLKCDVFTVSKIRDQLHCHEQHIRAVYMFQRIQRSRRHGPGSGLDQSGWGLGSVRFTAMERWHMQLVGC